MGNYDAIQAVIDEVTDHPRFSWKAHIDVRRRMVYWGSDFICDLRPGTTANDVRWALDDYIEHRMQVR